ncbi:MAG: flavodoxin domain-containing protein [Propionibacteriaceae bacterium]|nr:flavodoxin domain-containing protein [Propionibacteriaceae bacterium]
MTETAIVYYSKHGTTAAVAARIADRLGGATLVDLAETPAPDLSGFGRIVVGGPVYAGRPDKRVTAFLQANAATLQDRPLALFVCGMEPDPAKRETEVAAAFPETLRRHAVGAWFVGGEFHFDRLGFIERAIVKKIVGATESVSALDDQAIADLVAALA